MMGTGFRCDQCSTVTVAPGEPMLRYQPEVPDGWVVLYGPKAQTQGQHFCGWLCVESFAQAEWGRT